jgi:hypothetical protein
MIEHAADTREAFMGKTAVVLGAIIMIGEAAAESVPFPFVIPWNDAAKTVVDVSALNPAPLDESRRIAARDGHFYDVTGRRVRFVGTNITAGDCFPAREEAPAIASRLRKYGFNLVRLHHMDAPWARPNIFDIDGNSYGKSTEKLSEESLARLDWLVYQLKLNGIYVDVNLHVSRQFTVAEGFPDADKLPEMGKVVGYFEPAMIERQKLYATQLLGHVNPHTGKRMGEDPVTAVIEITNEDSLLGSAGSIEGLPPRYKGTLDKGWNEWLKARYGATKKLLATWNAGSRPLGKNIMPNSRFTGGTKGWIMEQHEPAKAEMKAVAAGKGKNAPVGRALRVGDMKPDGTDWHLQVHQPGLTLADGELYTVSFWARADGDRGVNVGVRLDSDPWSFCGLDASPALTREWKRFRYSFVAKDTRPGHCRLSFTVGNSAVNVYLADVLLCPGGGDVELAKGENLEKGNMAMPGMSDTPSGRDFTAYLIDVERIFSQGIRDHVRGMGITAPVACSQGSYGGAGGLLREARLDWVDMHNYWQHPSFPNRSWDSNDYRTGNTSMVRDPGLGTFQMLAMYRAKGKPFTVSEYNHPAPNEYTAEEIPMIFAYAAWQDWDGVFPFAYGGAKADEGKIGNFFDLANHPSRMAFMPAAAVMFLSGSVGPAPETQTLVISESKVPDLAARGTDWWLWGAALEPTGEKVSATDFLYRRSSVEFYGRAVPARLETSRSGASNGTSLEWVKDKSKEALFTVDSPQVKVIVGFLGGRSVDLGGMKVAMDPTERNFLSLALAAMDGKPIPESGRLLLATVDKAENPGWEWNAERNFVRDAWGKGPTVAWGVPASVSVPTKAKRAKVYALDGTGARAGEVPAKLSGGRLEFRIGPEYKTLWYEVAAE